VVRFLRRDNEIFKASLDVATQERDRLQSQLVATQQALDQARQLLKEVCANKPWRRGMRWPAVGGLAEWVMAGRCAPTRWQERSGDQTQQLQSAAQHAELMKQLNELNLLRERQGAQRCRGGSRPRMLTRARHSGGVNAHSNATLREEATRRSARVAELEQELRSAVRAQQDAQGRPSVCGGGGRWGPARFSVLTDRKQYAALARWW